MFTVIISGPDGKIGEFPLEDCTFQTGSKGAKGTMRVPCGGKTYQTQINMVEVHSKPKATGAKAR